MSEKQKIKKRLEEIEVIRQDMIRKYQDLQLEKKRLRENLEKWN